jgi:hypothetical protein
MALEEQRLAQMLEAFRNKRELGIKDLRAGVGPRTLELMVEAGYAEVINPSLGKQAEGYAWRKSKAPAQEEAPAKGTLIYLEIAPA